MADADVVFSVTADDKEAQQKLNQLRREIERTSKAIENTGAKKDGITQQLEQARNAAKQTADEIAKVQEQLNATSAKMAGYSTQKHAGMASIPVDEYLAAKDTLSQQLARRAELQSALQKQQAEVAKLEGQEQKVLAVLQQQTSQLEAQKTEAGGVERALAQQSTSVMPQLAAATEQVSTSMRRGLKNILKWGIGIRSAFALMRMLRSAIKEGVAAFAEQDAETKASIDGLKSSLQTLKISWGAAFAPILNAVAPLLQRLISLLTAAANAIAQFFAILGGRGTYKKAIANNDKLAKSYGGAGGAAEKAEKQILGFDEINKLNENSGGGGGGGAADALKLLDQVVNPKSLAAKMAFAVKDVLFDWSDLTPEQIAEKAIAGVSMLGGAIIGGMIGGIPGIIIGAAAGLAFGILLNACTFNFDGQLDAEEIAKIVNMALLATSGGVIGFMLGGPLGAAIGIMAGLAFAVLLNKTLFNGDGQLDSEEIAKIVNTALLAVSGGVIGFALGGPLGAAIGVAAGVAFSVLLNKSIFNSDGQLDENELYSIIALALGAIGGGIFGFVLGGPAGAAIGVTLGLAISFGLIEIDKDNAFFNAIEEFIQHIKDKIAEYKAAFPDDAAGITAAFILGLINGLWDGLTALFTSLGNWCQSIIDKVKEFFGIHSPSTVFADIGKSLIDGLVDGLDKTWQNVMRWFSDKWNALKTWWEGLSLGAFDFKTPHLEVTWEEIPSNSILARFLGFTSIPHLGISWYAKGGIVDGATLIGAGEAGKEAIVPLERNTEWVNMVANGIVDALTSSSKLEDYISGLELPSVMTGQIVPPRALNGGSMFSDGDIQRLVSGITAAFTQGGGEESIKLFLDGKQIAETVTKHQRRMERGFA